MKLFLASFTADINSSEQTSVRVLGIFSSQINAMDAVAADIKKEAGDEDMTTERVLEFWEHGINYDDNSVLNLDTDEEIWDQGKWSIRELTLDERVEGLNQYIII